MLSIIPVPGGTLTPKVTISASGVAAYTFTRQIDSWTWMSSKQPQQQPYNGEVLPIQENGTVTVIDGTQSFEFGSLSQALESNSIQFIASGTNGKVFYVTLEDQPMTSAVYYIQNVNSGLYLQAGTGVTQQQFNSSASGFRWRLIDLGNNVFRVFSVGTGKLLYAASAASGTALSVGTATSSSAVVNWLRDGDLFRAVSNTNLVWDVKGASKSPGAVVQIYTKSNNKNQQFTTSTQQPS
jgi:Ricin-type beta-trefoil lectin domain-like